MITYIYVHPRTQVAVNHFNNLIEVEEKYVNLYAQTFKCTYREHVHSYCCSLITRGLTLTLMPSAAAFYFDLKATG